ncbi:MAG: hypothetical protein ORN98_07495, partial [Alphaproteobacteria bacterium]|nr:hypothetical protein [Alphaproteobacteria bacterium]
PMAGDNYAYQNPRSRHAPRYDLGGTEQPDVGMISGHHYGDGQRPTHNSSPQPSFELSPPQAAIPTNAHESIPSMERVRPRRMSLTPIPGRTVEGGGTRPNDGNLPHHSATQNRDSSENE